MNIDPKIVEKMRGWCARQERSHAEVKRKLYSLEIYGQSNDAVLTLLIEEGYVNEMRFAEAFASGKFKIKGWGNRKIMQGLRQRGVSEKLANKALAGNDADAYRQMMENLLERYAIRLKETNPHLRKAKTARYLLQKGYESEIVWEAVNRYFV